MKKWILKNFIFCFFIFYIFNIDIPCYAQMSSIPCTVDNLNLNWSKKIINVYIEDNKQTIKQMFLDWNNKADNIYQIYFTDNKNKADIIVMFTNKKVNRYGALTTYFHDNDKILQADIILPNEYFSNDDNNQSLKEFVIKHEIGHALGIFRHSNNKKDIMYPYKTTYNKDITDNDIKLLKDSLNKKSLKPQNIEEIDQKNFEYDSAYLANIYKKAGKYDMAIKIYEEILDENPNFIPAAYSLGYCYTKLKEYKIAEKYLKQAYNTEPKNYIYLNSYIRILCILNKKDKAKKILNSYIKNNLDEKDNPIIKDCINITKDLK